MENDHRLPLISVVIPVYNEEENLPTLYDRLKRVCQELEGKADVELIFVNDGSSDGTAGILRKLAGRDARVVLVNLSRNFGSHPALMAGFSEARGDYIWTISGDLQDPPELLPEYFNMARSRELDVVWGCRRSRVDPWHKKLFASIFYFWIRMLTDLPIPRKGVDNFMMSRRVVEILLKIPEKNTMFYYIIMWMGFRQDFIDYDRGARLAGVSKWTFRRRLKNAVDTLLTFSSFPIQLISYMGMLFFLLSVIFALYLILNYLVGEPSPGWTSTALIISLATGIQMLMLGIIGAYLWRIMDQVRGRPQVIVREVYRSAQEATSEDTPLKVT